jgi:hypothetical protein
MKPYEAMTASSILAIGVSVDKFDSNQAEAYLQSCLVRLGYELGNIDGLVGRKTKQALKDAGIEFHDVSEVIPMVEDMLQEKYPEEYRETAPMEDVLFDYEVPENIEG